MLILLSQELGKLRQQTACALLLLDGNSTSLPVFSNTVATNYFKKGQNTEFQHQHTLCVFGRSAFTQDQLKFLMPKTPDINKQLP